MPNYRRPRPSTGPVFFTLCLAERGSTALVDHLDLLRAAVSETKRDRPFDILAFVVLPDHLHAIWDMPEDDRNYSQRWGRIKAHFSRGACRAGLVPPASGNGGTSPALRGGELGIWQSRFWEHHIRSQRDLRVHLEYCWADPVRHGLVDRPADWHPSSIHRDIRSGLLAPDWAGAHHEGDFGEADGADPAGPSPMPLSQRVNFLNFTRFGSSASAPSRRFLSSS